MATRFRIARWPAALLGTLLLLPAMAAAGDADDYGKTLYGRYCSACHGASGRGDGVVSQLMRPEPADLTQLAKKAGG